MNSRFLILLLVISFHNISLFGQDLHVGVKYGAGFSKTDFAPKDFTFSTIDNETDHILGIQSERVWSSPVLHVAFKSKNRLGMYLDLSTQTFTYKYAVDRSISDDGSGGLYTPGLANSYFNSSLGVTIDIVQTKLVKPYIRVGAGINSLLFSEEQTHKEQLMPFTEQEGREVRNAIMFEYLTGQKATYIYATAGLGLKVYNFHVEGSIDQSITALDKAGAYPSQSRLFIMVGVDLLRFNLVKKQGYEH